MAISPENRMTRKAKIILALAVVLLGTTIGAMRMSKSLSCKTYVCTSCGLKRDELKEWIGPIQYRDQVTTEGTLISQALKVKNCPHPSWFLYRWSYDSGTVLGGWSSFFDGSSRSTTLQLLLLDDQFATNLAQMKQPSAVLKDLLIGLDNSRKLDDSLSDWWQDPDHAPFSNWWNTNRQLIRTALAQTNR
jgi:hypothetical protein